MSDFQEWLTNLKHGKHNQASHGMRGGKVRGGGGRKSPSQLAGSVVPAGQRHSQSRSRGRMPNGKPYRAGVTYNKRIAESTPKRGTRVRAGKKGRNYVLSDGRGVLATSESWGPIRDVIKDFGFVRSD